MKYSLNAGEWNSVIAVPAGVVDKYIKLASGNSLKLLLFLLRHGGESYSDEALKEALGFKLDGELEDAALFWVQRGLIRYDTAKTTDESNAFTPASVKPKELNSEQLTLDEAGITDSSGISQTEEPKPSAIRKVGAGNALYYSSGDIGSRIKTDSQVSYLFAEAQKLYGRELKTKEMQCTIALIDFYGLPATVAVMLLKYCFQVNKTSPSYIQSVAQNWSDDEINTIELADARIAALERRNSVEEKLRAAMEFKSKFTAKQQEYIRVWTEEWGFGEDMIMLAYDITVNATGEMKFQYANKILDNWNAAGVFTKEAAEQLSAAHKSAAKNTSNNNQQDSGAGSSFDVDDVLAQIRSKYRNITN